MATSPLFGWQEPDDTSLVKDGAAAIRTLGNAIDTSMGDLLGGTTGQVLAKASNTNMDFTWVAQDDSNAIQNAIVDAKGDLIAATANDTPARLAVGNNGETLVADSSTSTGLRYQAPVNANPVLNSAMQVWQRGTSFAVSGSASYTADRWQAISAAYTAGLTVSRQATNDTTNLPNIQYCARVQRDSGNTSTAARNLQQNFESINSIPYAGKTVTLSFYARAGANFSSASNLLQYYFASGTGTDQNFYIAGFTGQNAIANSAVTLTTTWQRFQVTGTVPTNATQLAVNFYFGGVGTAGTNDYFEVTGVQMEVGSVATPFKTYAGTIQGELAACQRYYYITTSADGAFTQYGTGQAYSASAAKFSVNFPVTMRVAPASVVQVGSIGALNSINTAVNVGTITVDSASKDRMSLIITGSTGLTAGNATAIMSSASTATSLSMSAEL